MHQGRKVLDDDLAAIRRAYDPRTVRLEPLDAKADTTALASLPEVERVRTADRGHEIRLRRGTDPAAAMRSLLSAVPAARIELSRPRLEDIFVDIVGAGATGGNGKPSGALPADPGGAGGLS